MPAKPAPLNPAPRPVVWTHVNVPPVKLKRLLDQPSFCGKAASAYEAVTTVGQAILLDLPDYCRKKEVEPGAVVTAMSVLLSTFEVFKEQHELDRKTAEEGK